MAARLSDAQLGVLSRLVEGFPAPRGLGDLVAQTDAEARQLRLRWEPARARQAAEALERRGLASRVGRERWAATEKGRDLIAGGV